MYKINVSFATENMEENVILKMIEKNGEASLLHDVLPELLQRFNGAYTNAHIAELQKYIDNAVESAREYNGRPIVCIPRIEAGDQKDIDSGTLRLIDMVYKCADEN